MEEYVTIQVHRAVCVIEPQLMTITPKYRTGTKIIVSRITGEILSQDILLGLGISPKRRIALHDIVRIVGRRVQGDHILRLTCPQLLYHPQC